MDSDQQTAVPTITSDEPAERRYPVVRSAYHRVIPIDAFAIVPYSSRVDLIALSSNPNVLEQRVSVTNIDDETQVELTGVRTSAEYTDEAHFRLDCEVAAQMALNVLKTLLEMEAINPEELQHNIDRIVKDEDAGS